MKKTNKSITSVKKLGNKALNESITLVKDKKAAPNKSHTKVGKTETNKSITSVLAEKKSKINKSTTLVGKTKKQESDESHAKVFKNSNYASNESVTLVKDKNAASNKSNTKVGKQENKDLNESVTLVESKELQLFKNASKFKALEEMLDMKSKMAEVIDWYEKKHKNVIEIPELKINAKALHGNLILKTFKLYESAVKKIADFVEKHSQYKQQDIISQALIEFAERYH